MTTAQHSKKTISLRSARRASLAGGVGTLIEYYDFSVYGFLTLTIGPLFFPSDNPTVSTLSALAVFASSYLIRPLGGWFFSRLGDRRGRRTALVATIVMMGVACGVMGLLPTYGQKTGCTETFRAWRAGDAVGERWCLGRAGRSGAQKIWDLADGRGGTRTGMSMASDVSVRGTAEADPLPD
ncbi:MFS transporter [Streptomyces violaceusniger]